MDRLTTSLQESVLTLLATNDTEGKIAATLLEPDVFDEVYRDIAERVLAFRKRHSKAPGTAHLDDVMDDLLASTKNKKHRQYVRILEGVMNQAEGLNAPYILSRVHEFTRRQALKSAILEAGDLYQQGNQEDLVTKVEGVLNKALKPPAGNMDTGVRLNDRTRVLNMLERTRADYKLGIDELDHRNLGPTRGQLLMLLGAKGIGKSWWCVDIGKKGLMQGAKVLHITLEMQEDEVLLRYYQSMFAMGKRPERYRVTELEFDKLDRITGFRRRRRKIGMNFESPDVTRFLRKKLKTWGTRFGDLVIKGFPSGSLSIPKLEGYLDMMELHEGFIPDVVICDYPDLMYLDSKDFRLSLGRTVVDFRGIMQKRNMAGVAPTQTSKKGWDNAHVKASMVSEDASKFRTADKVLIYNRSEFEKTLGLARLDVWANRGDEDGFSVVITQNYKTGQFVLDSARMHNNYMELIKPDPEDGDDDDEAND